MVHYLCPLSSYSLHQGRAALRKKLVRAKKKKTFINIFSQAKFKVNKVLHYEFLHTCNVDRILSVLTGPEKKNSGAGGNHPFPPFSTALVRKYGCRNTSDIKFNLLVADFPKRPQSRCLERQILKEGAGRQLIINEFARFKCRHLFI